MAAAARVPLRRVGCGCPSREVARGAAAAKCACGRLRGVLGVCAGLGAALVTRWAAVGTGGGVRVGEYRCGCRGDSALAVRELTSNQARLPAEFKHITKRRKRN